MLSVVNINHVNTTDYTNIINQNVNDVDENLISDPDLVKLAGHYAYIKPKEGRIIEVDGTEYEVNDAVYNHETGLDAFTIKNIDTKGYQDLIVVFVGSEQLREDWLETSVNLLSNLTPRQLKEVERDSLLNHILLSKHKSPLYSGSSYAYPMPDF